MNTSSTLTLISYELYCTQKRCFIRHALCCHPSDADNRINTLDKKYGKMFKLMHKQDRSFTDK